MRNLAVEVRRLDDVAVHQAEDSDASAGQVRSRGAAETADADDENGCLFQSQLACIGVSDCRRGASGKNQATQGTGGSWHL